MTLNACRLCLKVESEIIDGQADAGDGININSIISKYFPWFQINKADSSCICLKCWLHIDQFNLFYKNIENIQAKLKRQCTIDKVEKKNIKIETIECYPLPTINNTANSLLILNQLDVETDVAKFEERDEDGPEQSDENIEKEFKNVIMKNKRKKVKIKRQPHKIHSGKYKDNRLEYDKKIRDFFKLNCEMCTLTHNTFRDIKKHYLQAHNIRRGYVICCKKKLFRQGDLLEHMDWHSNPDAFRCEICDKQCMAQYTLKLHMHKHTSDEDRVFKCNECGKGFSMKYLLKQHLRLTHIADERKIYKCEECGLRFGMPSMLQSHIRGVHKFANTHMCDICAKLFKSKLQCERHRTEHQNNPKLQCDICKAWLKNKHSLLSHITRRHRSLPIACSHCGKMAPNKDALRNHMKYLHTDDRLHECKICGKAFKRPIGLKEHMAQHTGGFLYTCQYCPKTFNSNANMHSHRKKAHPLEWNRDRKSMSNTDAV